jgi:glucokinase
VSEFAVGVDVGGTKVLALAVSEVGDVIDSERVSTPHVSSSPPGAATAQTVFEVLCSLAERNHRELAELVVGIGLPGMMSRDGRLVFAPNLPSASGADIGALILAHDSSLRVLCENDADCAVIAEHRLGAARGVSDVVMVTLGTGIGGGIISGGELLRGRSGFAGEIGHMVLDASGPRCPCGGRGCWERYASGAGVARLTREAAAAGRLSTLVNRRGGDVDAVRAEDLTAAASEGLREALDVIDEVGWWLALGIANLAAILDCGTFVVGGGLVDASTLLLVAARRHLSSLVEGSSARGEIHLVAAHFAERAGAVGAALLARERFA